MKIYSHLRFSLGCLCLIPAFAQSAATSLPVEATKPSAAQYQQSCLREVEASRAMFAAIISTPADDILESLNNLEVRLSEAYNKAQLYSNVHPDTTVREAAENCEQDFSELVTQISLSRPLYDAIQAADINSLDESGRRYRQHTLRDFRRAGVDKDEKSRKRITALQDELVKLGQAFSKNIRDDVRSLQLASAAELAGLPADYIAAHAADEKGIITITTDYPDYIPFMKYAANDALRFELYKKFRNRGYPDNDAVLKAILHKRFELAQILGYKNYAEYITEDKMIGNASAVASFIEKISGIADKRAAADYQVLLKRLQQINPQAREVGDWQKDYISELVRQEQYQFDSREVRQYFAYDKVRDGIFRLVDMLFEIDIQPADTATWDDSVEAYEVYDKGQLIARFFLDMHPREGKYKHAAHFPLQGGLKDRQLPVSALVCNFPGGGDDAGLMSHDQVETFLHEFGHLLHHIFAGQQRWLSFSGVATEWDFVEAPSQMLEEWIWDADTLKLFASNAAGEILPDALIEKMQSTRYFSRGLWVKNQMFYAATSLNYYNRDPAGFELQALMVEMQKKYSPYDYVEGTHFYASFGHLDGYSAMYYTYMWSLVIANDLFSKFESSGLLNKQVAGQYRRKVLAAGGSRDAADLVADFLGRAYNFDAFEKELNKGSR